MEVILYASICSLYCSIIYNCINSLVLSCTTGTTISKVLISNMCEVFDGKIDKGRDKPVIGCLEYIREYLMNRICTVMKEMKKAKGPFTPTTTNILDT
uniref:Uncharacterized protein n=1 Tax=Lactuca sativa TaxID=4236 RepID=A0A9R1W0J8_LACSA|nr:hypothetical protein LSAT_V11C400227600 [Lactuca sativa]